MRGRVEKQKGRYVVVLEFDRDPATQKRKRKVISVKKELGLNKNPTKKQAEELLVKKLNELQEGVFVEPSYISVYEYMDLWLKSYGHKLKDTTKDNYNLYIKNHIKPSLGSYRLIDIKPYIIQDFYSQKLESGLAGSTVRKIHNILRRSLSDAVVWNMLKSNPVESVTPPRIDNIKQNTWSQEQLNCFLEYVKGHLYYPLYYLLAHTGLRRGEAIGLCWSDVDLKERILYIQRALVVDDGGKLRIESLKNTSSERAVPISKKVAALLKEHKKKQQKERFIIKNDNNYVFTNEVGNPIYPSNIRRHMNNVIERLDLPYITIHGFRHTHATLLLKRGVHPKVVQERLGHSSIRVTMDRYSHVSQNLQKSIIDSLEEEDEQDENL